MNSLTIADVSIRVDAKGRYCLNDLHKAAGGEARHEPHQFMRLDQTQALAEEINSADQRISVQTKRGANGGTFVARELVYAYPSTPKEAFEQAVEGAIYGEEMTFMRERGRIVELPIDPLEPVNTFWDLGSNDHTAIWLHQQVGQWHHFIGYMHDTHVGLRKWWQRLEDFKTEHGFERWGKHWLPHDGKAERQGEEIESAFSILSEKLKVKNVEIVPRVSDLSTGIDLTREAMVKQARICSVKCADGIKCLDAYQYVWDEKRGMWSSEPYHNWASNGSDAFRQWAQRPRQPEMDTDSVRAFKSRKRSGL